MMLHRLTTCAKSFADAKRVRDVGFTDYDVLESANDTLTSVTLGASGRQVIVSALMHYYRNAERDNPSADDTLINLINDIYSP